MVGIATLTPPYDTRHPAFPVRPLAPVFEGLGRTVRAAVGCGADVGVSGGVEVLFYGRYRGVRSLVKTVLLHLERLRRHYDVAVKSYDQVALLDLSHILRIWVELKQPIVSLAPAFATTISFKTGLPAKKVLNAARGHPYIFCYMPGGVITYASNGSLVSAPEMEPDAGAFSMGVTVKVMPDHTWLGKFYIVAKSFDQSLIKAMDAETQTRCNYQQWLGSEVVRVCFRGSDGVLKQTSISREMIVKRVANTLDGSHPSTAAWDTGNTFDEPVHHLLKYAVGGIHLPYFILLKIAQDILANAPKLLGLEDPKAAT